MANSASFRDEAAGERPGLTLKALGLCIAGWLVGYLVSCVSSILLFVLSGISPHEPASALVITLTALYGMAFAVLAAVVGASFSRRHALGIGCAIACTIAAVAFWSDSVTPTHAHWSQMVAIFLMAPSAQLGSLFRRLPY